MRRPRNSHAIDPPYDQILRGVLSFADFSGAEATLRRLEQLRQQYLAAGDPKGVASCRQLAALGRQRAELISRNRRVAHNKRVQKKELANWFRIWLETPDLFADWLALRKKTPAFLRLQGADAVNSDGQKRYIDDPRN